MSQPPVLPPGWTSQWDHQAGRNVFTETATGRTSWQPPNVQMQPGRGPTHPQGAARMSMPPMQGPPGMRSPMAETPGVAQQPMPQGPDGATSPPVGVTASRRRAYPTAPSHAPSNSTSFSAGYDAAAQQPAAYGQGAPAMSPSNSQQQPGQFFTPGAPEVAPAGYGASQGGYQNDQQPAYPGMAAAGGGMAGLTSQFAGMGVGGAKGNALYTVNLSSMQPNVNDLEKPPPDINLPPGSCISQHPLANADPSYQRCTLNAIPQTASMLNKSKLPLGIVLSPYRSVREEDGDSPVPVVTDSVIARCRRCRTYINPYVQFIEGGKRWKCCLCNITNEVPQLFDWDQEKNQPADRWQRPELTHAVVDFIAPREYMVRPPQPPVYTFLIDVSHAAVQSGMVATAARTILDTLPRIPNENDRTKVSIIAVDTSLHFFCLPPGSTEAEMLVVSDLDDVFLPKPNDILVNLTECRAGIESLLTRLPDMFKDNTVAGSALGAALQAAYKLVSPIGGKIMTLTATMPSVGPGALKRRDDPKLLGTNKESTLLAAASTFYKTFPIDCSRSQVSVDMFLFSSAYTDVATLACLPRYTGGQTYFYPAFHAARSEDAVKFSREFAHVLSSPISYEAVLRLRATKGIRAIGFHGNFFVRSTDLLALPSVPLDQSYAIECEIEEPVTLPFIVFQSVVLHSASNGERRIRVANLAIPTTTSMSEVYSSADQVAIATLLANKAVERSIHSRLEDARDALTNKMTDILTVYKTTMTSAGGGASAQLSISHNLALLPLLILSLLKHVGIRASSQVPPDLRAYAQALLTTLPVQLLVPYVHPSFFCLHNMPANAGTWIEGTAESTAEGANGEEANGKVANRGLFILPPKLNLSSERLERHGLYLLEDGQNIFLWVGRDAVPQLTMDVFEVPNYAALRGGKTTLPQLDNSMNKRVNAIVERVRTMRRGPYYPHVYIVKEDGEPSLRLWALSLLVEDRFEAMPSYQQFLGTLRSKVNGSN